MSICGESLKNKLLSALKTDDFWIEFLDVIGCEIGLMRDKISETKDIFNIDKQLENGLIDIANTFGYTPNLIVDNSLEMVKKEVESIPSRIRNKTTYYGYYIIFKQIGKLGDVYNYYWCGDKLIRAISWNSIDEQFKNLKYDVPFVTVEPDKNFSIISSKNAIFLDDGEILDSASNNKNNWMLDKNKEISPTKHLGIEYYPRTFDDFDKLGKNLITSDYFQYLSTGVEYNRRIPIVPHIGIQLIAFNREGGGYNAFNSNNDYTIPDLKLNFVTGFEYNKIISDSGTFNLDEGERLDELISWTLDKTIKIEERVKLDDFKYISCGNGNLHIQNEDMINLFDYSSLVLFYSYGDNDDSFDIKDYSINNNTCELVGIDDVKPSTKKVNGIIGKTVNFDGITSIKSKNPISLIETELSFGFWINANDELNFYNDSNMCVLDFDFFKVYYNYVTEIMSFYFGNNVNEVSVERNKAHNVIIEINNSEWVKYYVDCEMVGEIEDISDVPYAQLHDLYIGSDLNNENKFVGVIDSTWLMHKIYSDEEKRYICENKQGITSHLGHKLAHYPLNIEHEGHENDDWLMIQSHIKACDVEDEFEFFAEKSVNEIRNKVNIFYNGVNVRLTVDGDDLISSNYFDLVESNIISIVYVDNQNNYIFKSKEDNDLFYSDEGCSIPFTGSTSDYNENGFRYYENVTELIKDLIDNNYIGKTDFAPIKDEYFSMYYEKLNPNGIDHDIVELKANKYGDLYNINTNETISGNINFATGEYSLHSLNEHYVTQEEEVSTVANPQRLLCNLKGDQSNSFIIKKGSVAIKYKFKNDDTYYYLYDNGLGVLSGLNVSFGEINYNTGLINVYFDSDLDLDEFIPLGEYVYYLDLGMIEGTSVKFSYKTNDVPITEIGFENENHELLAYMNFPPINFDTINNHISVLMAIKKIKDS